MKIMVLDFETSISKGPHSGTFRDPHNDFYTVIYGDSESNIIVKHKEKGFKRTLPEETLGMLKVTDILIGHNLQFDLSYIWHLKDIKDFILRGGKVYDTQIGEYLISGQRHSFPSLAELQLIYLEKKIKEDRISKLFSKGHGADEIINKRFKYHRIFSLFNKYCYGDGISTIQVFKKQVMKLKELNMLKISQVYNNYMLALIETTVNGLAVDVNISEKILQKFKLKSIDYLQKSSAIVSEYWSDERLPPFNIKSPTHKSSLLFGGKIKCKVVVDNGFYKSGKPKTKIEEQHVEITGFNLDTKLTNPSGVPGRYQTGREIMDKIADSTNDPVILQYCELQRKAMNIEKMCATYLEPFINLSVDGFIHPTYNNTATATGRLSSSKPNLQNIVSKGGMEKYIKRPLIAPEGYICCSIDFSQLEIYVLALLSKDPILIDDLLKGIDFHILRLSYAEDMEYDEVYKLCKIDKLPEWELKRTKAKTISYQKIYGASPKSLAKSTGLDESVVQKIFDKEDITYSGVKDFNDRVANDVRKTSTMSYAKNIPKYKKGFTKCSKRFIGGIELLPVMRDKLNADYFDDVFRHVGYYTSITNKRYAFEEMANYNYKGSIRKGFSPTQIKNYPMQGTAADVVALATAEVFKYSLTTNNTVKLCNQIHDSLEFYIKKGSEDLTIKTIQSIMNNIPGLFKKYLGIEIPFQFKTDVKIGDDFANMHEFK